MPKFNIIYFTLLHLVSFTLIFVTYFIEDGHKAEYFVYDIFFFILSVLVFSNALLKRLIFKNYHKLINLCFIFILISPTDLFENITCNKITYISNSETLFRFFYFNYNRVIPIMYALGIITILLFIFDLINFYRFRFSKR